MKGATSWDELREEWRAEMHDKPAQLRYFDEGHKYACKLDPAYLALAQAADAEEFPTRWSRVRDGLWRWRYYLDDVIWRNIRPVAWKWRWQRMRRGWADCDTWNYDWYLSKLIAEGGRHMTEHGHLMIHTEDEFHTFVEGMRHYAEGCDMDCPHVERSVRMLPDMFHRLWD